MGSQACVDLYNNGTILDIYKAARKNATRLSWKIDGFEEFAKKLSSNDGYKKAHIFVDNSGADIVLGVLPFVVELLRRGTEVVLVANALPALNDVTADELSSLLDRAAETCGGILKSALYFDEDEKEEAPREEEARRQNSPSFPLVTAVLASTSAAPAANSSKLPKTSTSSSSKVWVEPCTRITTPNSFATRSN